MPQTRLSAGLRITIVLSLVAATSGSVRAPLKMHSALSPIRAIGKGDARGKGHFREKSRFRGTSHLHPAGKTLVHDVGLIQLELSEKSTFGGFFLPHDPPSNAGQWPGSNGQNYLAGGGLWIGTRSDSVDRVMHDYYWASPSTGDWVAATGEVPTAASGISDQDLRVVYTDSAAPHPLGLHVIQTSRQWAAPGLNEFIVFEYEISNVADRPLDQVFASFWIDPDLVLENNTFIYDDLVAWDAGRQLVYAFDSGQTCQDPLMNPENILCPPGFIGLQLLVQPVAGKSARRPHTAAPWNPEQDPVRTILDTDESFLKLMTGGIDTAVFDSTSAVGDDYRMLVTAQPFSLDPGTSVRVAFGLVIGESLDGLGLQADAMSRVFERTPLPADIVTGHETLTAGHVIASYPNPFSDRTTIEFEIDEPTQLRVAVYDMLGREVKILASGRFAAGLQRVTWQPDGLPNGTYFCRIEGADGRSVSTTIQLAR